MFHTCYVKGSTLRTRANELQARAEQSPVWLLQHGATDQPQSFYMSNISINSSRGTVGNSVAGDVGPVNSRPRWLPALLRPPPPHPICPFTLLFLLLCSARTKNSRFLSLPAQLLIDQTSVCLDNCRRLQEA